MIPYTSLKIQGFQSLFRSQSRFSSLKAYFQKQDSMNFIEFSHNSNIKSFYILLMNYIQRQHYKKLIFELKAQEQSIQSGFRRQRKVSFNGKNNGVFKDSEEGQVLTLHRLKNYIFSQNSNFQIIENSPMKHSLLNMSQNQNKINIMPKYTPYLKRQFSSQIQKDTQNGKNIQKDSLLSSKQIKRILAQFLKMLLPESIDKNYKSQIKSVNSLLQLYPTIFVALNILMRCILLTKYKINEAKYYDQFISDKLVIYNLCDAFGLQGLKEIQNGFQIKKQYKIYVVKWNFKQFQINHQVLCQNLNLKNSKIRQTQTSENKERQDLKNKNQKQVYIVAMPKELSNSFNNSFFKNNSINLNLKKRNDIKKNKEKRIKDKEKGKLNFFESQKLPNFNNSYDISTKNRTLAQQNHLEIQNNAMETQPKRQIQVQRPFFANFRKSIKQIQSKRGSYKSSEPNSPSSPTKKLPIDPKIHQQLNLSHSYHSNLDKSDFEISNNEILDDIQKVLNLDF